MIQHRNLGGHFQSRTAGKGRDEPSPHGVGGGPSGSGLGRLGQTLENGPKYTQDSHMHGQATSSPLGAVSVAEQPSGTAWLVPAINDLQFSNGYINKVKTGGNNFINGFFI